MSTELTLNLKQMRDTDTELTLSFVKIKVWITLRTCGNGTVGVRGDVKMCVVAGDGVEVVEQRVAVCRDAAKGQCCRSACKYYHIPIALPPAPVMAALASYLQ